jgi:excisionase family DNA binding protein
VTTERVPAAPAGAGAAGRRLWRSVVTDFSLAEHETALLREAVHVADTCAELQTRVAACGGLAPHLMAWVAEVERDRVEGVELGVGVATAVIAAADADSRSVQSAPVPRIFGTREAATDTGVTDGAIRQAIANRKLSADKAGGRWRIDADELDRWNEDRVRRTA